MAKLTLNIPSKPKGHLFEIPPYGMLANGEVHDLPALDEDFTFGVSFDEAPPEDPPPVKTGDDSSSGDDDDPKNEETK